MSQRTLRHAVAALPVKTLQVEVLDGDGAGKRVQASSERLSIGSAVGNDLLLTEPTVSRVHVELAALSDGIAVSDCGSTNGTKVGDARIREGVVPAGTVLQLGRVRVRVGEGAPATVELHGEDRLSGLRGTSAGMRRLMAQMERAAASEAPVLLNGESGTGKEVVARGLHELSPRSDRPLVVVDCASLTPTLVASELFGHEKGAFTGADRQHIGAFERADGGVIFLDEIGELPAALQPSLLGVLERRCFRRLGGKHEIEVDVRVLSATHRDLRKEVNAGAFRLDLYYRLAVVRLQVPPLRERSEDIPLLVEHFLREAGYDGHIQQLISQKVMDGLRGHRWPGNVRELRNLVEATLAMGEPPPLESVTDADPARVDVQGRPLPADPGKSGQELLEKSYRDARADVLQHFERRYLEALLQSTDGNVSQAARQARMDRSHLSDLLRRHQLR